MRFCRFIYLVLFAICLVSVPVMAYGSTCDSETNFTKGIQFYHTQKIDSAIICFSICNELDKHSESPIYKEYSAAWLARCYYLAGQEEKAKVISDYYKVSPIDRRQTSSIDSLYTIASFYFDKSEYDKAQPLYKECFNLINNNFDEIHILYSGILEEYSLTLERLKRYEECLEIQKELIKVIGAYYGEHSKEYANELLLLSSRESYTGKFNDAISHSEIALQMYSQLGEDELKYQTLCKISNYQSFLGKYDDACNTILQVLNDYKENCLTNMPLYVMAMNDYADYLLKLGRISDGIKICDEAIILCSINGKNDALYATTLNVKANLEQARGNFRDAIKFGETALAIKRTIYGEVHPEYALILNNLARYYMGLGQFQYCIELQNKVLSNYLQYYGIKEENYATGLNNLAEYYDKIGNTQKSLQIEEEALSLWDNMYGKLHPDYAMALTIIANYYSKLGNNEQAIALTGEALNIKLQIFGRNNPDYAISLNNYAYYNFLIGNIDIAIEKELEVLDILQSVVGKSSPDYAMSLIVLSEFYEEDEKSENALLYLEQAKSLYEESIGTNNPAFAYCVGKLALMYAHIGETEKAEDYAEAATSIFKDIVLDNFRFLTANERQQLWGMYQNWFENTLPSIANINQSQKLNSVLYDGELLRKGLLLNAELALRDLLVESNDTVMLHTFDELVELKKSLQKQQELGVLTKESSDSINALIAKSERRLIDGSQVYGDYTSNLSSNWIDIKNKLGKGELAVEYFRFYNSYGNVMYAALALSAEDNYPRYITLCTESKLSQLLNEDRYSNDWGTPFLKELVYPILANGEEITAIYFSPDGVIHNIPLENIFDKDSLLNNQLKFYRLSSTRQLYFKSKQKRITNASLFGGISYDSEPILNGVYLKQYIDSEVEPIIRGSVLTNGYEDLPSTEIEIESIDEILTHDGVVTTTFIHDKATETAFKLMSQQSVNIIHIATHGFYWTEQDAANKKSKNALLPIITSPGLGDVSLSRSGLILAGANKIIRDRIRFEGQEDGILTAREIAYLDFRNIDLVVLSACQTGLGEISGDGVFGLQRGFKKSGVHTIVMSLWSVDDEATRILMGDFYRNITMGCEPQIALFNAQRYLRSNYSCYSAPYYWAAFIILDAI